MSNLDAEKRLAAQHAVRMVKDGMRVGLGSGSTAEHAIRFLGERIRTEKLRITSVPSSPESRALAEANGIPLIADASGFELDIAIDGADQVTRAGAIIKGGGGALLHERIVAAAARKFVIIADSSKLVDDLGGIALPVEVVQFGARNAVDGLKSLGCEPRLREKVGRPFVTEEGNFIVDCLFSGQTLADDSLDAQIRAVPGVVDHGLFSGMAHLLVIAREGKITEIVLK